MSGRRTAVRTFPLDHIEVVNSTNCVDVCVYFCDGAIPGAKGLSFTTAHGSCKIIEKNLKLNNYDANIYQKALVHNDVKTCYLFIGNENQVWRNSIVKKWNNKGIKVDCVNFDSVQKKYDCCKMDIEGAEILILQKIVTDFKKFVFEWSFDVDRDIDKLRNAIKIQSINYNKITENNVLKNKNFILWKPNWFPMAMNIFMSK